VNLKVKNYGDTRRKRRRQDDGFSIRTTLYLAFVLSPVCLLFAAAVAHIWMAAKTERLGEKGEKIRREMGSLDLETTNNRIKLENYKRSSFIFGQIERFDLKLGYPRPGQIVKISSPKPGSRMAKGDKKAPGSKVEITSRQ